jgi:hypothetical protein
MAAMNDEMTLGATTSLPVPPTGWFDYGYAVLCDGNLAPVRTDRDIRTAYGRWRDQVRSRGALTVTTIRAALSALPTG